MIMKLANELNFVENSFIALSKKHDLQSYVDEVKASNEYNNLQVRIAYDFARASNLMKYICTLSDKYGCNDTHIRTLLLKALKVLNLKF